MKKSKKPETFLEKTFYPGGNEAMGEFIKRNLKYPEDALVNGIQGIVSIKVEIDYRGWVIRTKIKKGLGYGCDEEAERVAKLLRFQATKNRGVRVTFHKNIRIFFQLPKPAEKPKPAYTYVITPTPPKKDPKPTPKKGSYTYTLTTRTK